MGAQCRALIGSNSIRGSCSSCDWGCFEHNYRASPPRLRPPQPKARWSEPACRRASGKSCSLRQRSSRSFSPRRSECLDWGIQALGLLDLGHPDSGMTSSEATPVLATHPQRCEHPDLGRDWQSFATPGSGGGLAQSFIGVRKYDATLC